MHRMQTTSLALLLLSLALGCNRQRPREGDVARVDTVMVFTAEGLGTYPQISDSSRLLPDGSFRFNPAAVPCPLRQDSRGWPLTHVALPAGTPGRLTIHLPRGFEGRSSQGASWVVWQGDSSSVPPARFGVAFRERPQGYPSITIWGVTRADPSLRVLRFYHRRHDPCGALYHRVAEWQTGQALRCGVLGSATGSSRTGICIRARVECPG
jgi:hypothetical protein